VCLYSAFVVIHCSLSFFVIILCCCMCRNFLLQRGMSTAVLSFVLLVVVVLTQFDLPCGNLSLKPVHSFVKPQLCEHIFT